MEALISKHSTLAEAQPGISKGRDRREVSRHCRCDFDHFKYSKRTW